MPVASQATRSKYYSKIHSQDVKNFIKCHIAVDADSRIIICSQAVKGPRHDVKFAMASIRSLKKIQSSVHNSRQNIWLKCNKDMHKWGNKSIKLNTTKIQLQICRRLTIKTFKKAIYSWKNNIGSVFSIIKRKYSGVNKSKSVRLQNKETRLKTLVYNIG